MNQPIDPNLLAALQFQQPAPGQDPDNPQAQKYSLVDLIRGFNQQNGIGGGYQQQQMTPQQLEALNGAGMAD